MKTYSKEELLKILEEHTKWIKDSSFGSKANLSGADLRWADLSGANLGGADLSGANLGGADLRCADLSKTNLGGANLGGADLSKTNLGGADLGGADLRCANLSGADLGGADLSGADLSGANLGGADLVYFTFNKHTAYFVFDGMIRIGCEYHKIETWQSKFKDIGKKEDYTDQEIAVYGSFIKMCARLQKEGPQYKNIKKEKV